MLKRSSALRRTQKLPPEQIMIKRSSSPPRSIPLLLPLLQTNPTLALLALALGAVLVVVHGRAGAGGTGLLGQRGGEDLGRKGENLAQVLDAGVGEEVVEPLPVELLLHVITRREGLHHHHHVQVRHVDVLMLGLGGCWDKVVVHTACTTSCSPVVYCMFACSKRRGTNWWW